MHDKQPKAENYPDDEQEFFKPRFEIEEVFMSENTHLLMQKTLLLEIYLDRHQLVDWDDSPEDDKQLNRQSLRLDGLVISRFNTPFGLLTVKTCKARKKTMVFLEGEDDWLRQMLAV